MWYNIFQTFVENIFISLNNSGNGVSLFSYLITSFCNIVNKPNVKSTLPFKCKCDKTEEEFFKRTIILQKKLKELITYKVNANNIIVTFFIVYFLALSLFTFFVYKGYIQVNFSKNIFVLDKNTETDKNTDTEMKELKRKRSLEDESLEALIMLAKSKPSKIKKNNNNNDFINTNYQIYKNSLNCINFDDPRNFDDNREIFMEPLDYSNKEKIKVNKNIEDKKDQEFVDIELSSGKEDNNSINSIKSINSIINSFEKV